MSKKQPIDIEGEPAITPQGGNYVKMADSVIFSGRWNTLEEKITSSNTTIFTTSQERTVFFSLFCALRTEYDCLRYDYYENKYSSLSLLAWRTRNLLEINTWCRFCCEDKANAQLFYKDAGRDGLDLEESLEKWGKETNQPSEWFEKIQRNRDKICNEAERHGILDLDAKYTSPLNAAKILGHEKTHRIHNKILSKFAHPTAYRILSSDSQEGQANRAYYFFSQGCLFFYDGFSRLEKFLEENEEYKK
jgi:hypothetical protein